MIILPKLREELLRQERLQIIMPEVVLVPCRKSVLIGQDVDPAKLRSFLLLDEEERFPVDDTEVYLPAKKARCIKSKTFRAGFLSHKAE